MLLYLFLIIFGAMSVEVVGMNNPSTPTRNDQTDIDLSDNELFQTPVQSPRIVQTPPAPRRASNRNLTFGSPLSNSSNDSLMFDTLSEDERALLNIIHSPSDINRTPAQFFLMNNYQLSLRARNDLPQNSISIYPQRSPQTPGKTSRIKRDREALETLWFDAIKSDNFDQKLIESYIHHYGMEINIQDCLGKTALHYAYEYNNNELIQLLLKNNADINIKDASNKAPKDYQETTAQKKSPLTPNSTFKNLLRVARGINRPESTYVSRYIASKLLKNIPKNITDKSILTATFALNTPQLNPDLEPIGREVLKRSIADITNCPICLETIEPKDGVIKSSCCAQEIHATCFDDFYTHWMKPDNWLNQEHFNCPACGLYQFNPTASTSETSLSFHANTLDSVCSYCSESCLIQNILAYTSANNSPKQCNIHPECLKMLLRNKGSLRSPQNPFARRNRSDSEETNHRIPSPSLEPLLNTSDSSDSGNQHLLMPSLGTLPLPDQSVFDLHEESSDSEDEA
jgi:Ankyrin repeats (3 copies)